jgi:hypothetical protein
MNAGSCRNANGHNEPSRGSKFKPAPTVDSQSLLSLLDSTGCVLRVVLEPLLDRFVSYKEPKPLPCIRVSCPLHIEVTERHASDRTQVGRV